MTCQICGAEKTAFWPMKETSSYMRVSIRRERVHVFVRMDPTHAGNNNLHDVNTLNSLIKIPTCWILWHLCQFDTVMVLDYLYKIYKNLAVKSTSLYNL